MISKKSPFEDGESGIGRIKRAFKLASTRSLAALMPYFTLGYPTPAASLDVIEAIATDSDLLELGVPFSDPIADGPTIQKSTQIALRNGITSSKCLEMVASLRRDRKVATPILLMGYFNPILAYGEARFVEDSAAVGVDGLIVPDLPIEEAGELAAAAKQSDIALIHFLAPTSSDARVQRVIADAGGFIYLVSVTGVTGVRNEVQSKTVDFIKNIKNRTRVPVAVGFGISTPKQARQVAEHADGIIFGSALIRAVEGSLEPARSAREFVREMSSGLIRASS